MVKKTLTERDYQRLLEFRTGLRRFLHWSRSQAATVGLTPSVHQLLLAVKGHPDKQGPTIGDVANYLLLRHHSVVQLVDRAAADGLIERVRDQGNRRVVRLHCTLKGEEKLRALTAATLEELARVRPELTGVWDGLGR